MVVPTATTTRDAGRILVVLTVEIPGKSSQDRCLRRNSTQHFSEATANLPRQEDSFIQKAITASRSVARAKERSGYRALGRRNRCVARWGHLPSG